MGLIAFFSVGGPYQSATSRLWHRTQTRLVKIVGRSPLCHVALGDATTGQVLNLTPAGPLLLSLDAMNLRPSTRLVVDVEANRSADLRRFLDVPPVRWWRAGRIDCVTVTRAAAATAGAELPFTLTPGALARALIKQGRPHEWYPAADAPEAAH